MKNLSQELKTGQTQYLRFEKRRRRTE